MGNLESDELSIRKIAMTILESEADVAFAYLLGSRLRTILEREAISTWP